MSPSFLTRLRDLSKMLGTLGLAVLKAEKTHSKLSLRLLQWTCKESCLGRLLVE